MSGTEWYRRNRERILAAQREKAKDPEWRAQRNAKAREYVRRRRMDPEYRAKTYASNNMHRYKRLFDLTPEQYNDMIAAQGGRCAVCGRRPTSRGFHVDHCHATGVVRGLLCNPCNSGIGLLGDTPEALMRALKYLREARKRQQTTLFDD